jgi:pimeloyl-ACP methyl ester carboxylesterase
MDDTSTLEKLQIRIHGAEHLPTLIYLPGLHGDWTLIGDFRKHLAGKVRLVEFTYPRTITWSLDEYAQAIETSLAENGIASGWLLGESYGSQLAWQLAARQKFSIEAIILAGGFVKFPFRWGVQFARITFQMIPLRVLTGLLVAYGKIARRRFRYSPETISSLNEFLVRRTELDRQAALHRLRQILGFDPSETARQTSLPIFYLSAKFDPVVPFMWVRHWLRKNCPALRDVQSLATFDHNILATSHAQCANQILAWMRR